MDRTQFLYLAQKVSTLKDGVQGIKINIPKNMQVIYNKIFYYPLGYEMKFKNGDVLHNAILHDLKANSVIHCPLENVKGCE
ncbi:MAG: hypothetical protein R3Y33_05705 [Clostridia bacterium]